MLAELQRVLSDYAKARADPFAGHPVASFIRGPLAATFAESSSSDYPEVVWHGSAGAGNWAAGPWLAAFDPAITTSAQRGYYPVFLFSSDLSSISWSMNQGVTDLQREFRAAKARHLLGQRADRIRARVASDLPKRFEVEEINLQTAGRSSLLGFYEAGHAFGITYSRDELPDENHLRNDVRDMLRLYRLASARGGTLDTDADQDDATAQRGTQQVIEGTRRYRYHRTLERSASLARAAKQHHGYTCQCCRFNFEQAFGALGREFIEAHHLVPLAHLDGDTLVPRSAENDFAVLCANCHRMIHRLIAETGGPVTLEALIERRKLNEA